LARFRRQFESHRTRILCEHRSLRIMFTMQMRLLPPSGREDFSGTLTKVDAATKVISVKGTGNEPEMTFMYDDKTQVTGAEETVEVLAGKSGAMLKVTYREEGGEPDRDENRGRSSIAKREAGLAHWKSSSTLSAFVMLTASVQL